MENFISFMSDIKASQFKNFLCHFNRIQIRFLKEIINNILKGVIELKEVDRAVLRKKRHFLRKLVARGTSKHDIVKQYKILHKILLIAKEYLS